MMNIGAIRGFLIILALSVAGAGTSRSEVFIYFDNASEPCYSADYGYLRYSVKFEPEDFGVKGNFSISSIFASATIPENMTVPLVVSDVPPEDFPDSTRYLAQITFTTAEWDTFFVDPPLELDSAFWITFSYPSQWIPFALSEPDGWHPDRNRVETSAGWGPITCNIALGVGVETPLGMEEERAKIPIACSLEQNYPNPFNPSTTISFVTKEAGTVELTLFDIRGRRIQTLMDGPAGPGRHAIAWRSDASLPSGIYFYQLRFGETAIRRKMFLSK